MGISRDKLHKRRATGGRRKVIRGKRKFELGRAPALTKIGEKRIHLVRTRGGHQKHRALRLNEGHFVWPGEAATKRSRILNVVYNATSNELVRTNTLVKGCIVQIDATPFKQWYEQFYRTQLGKATIKKEDDKKVAEPAKKAAEKPAAEKPADKKAAEPAKKGADAKKAAPAAKDAKKPADAKAAPPKKEEVKKADAKKPADAKAAPAKKDAAPAKKDAAPAKAAAAPAKKGAKDAKTTTAAADAAPKKPSHHLKRKINGRNKIRVLEQGLKDQFNTGRVLARISSRPGQSGRADGYILEGDELAFYLRKMDKKKN